MDRSFVSRMCDLGVQGKELNIVCDEFEWILWQVVLQFLTFRCFNSWLSNHNIIVGKPSWSHFNFVKTGQVWIMFFRQTSLFLAHYTGINPDWVGNWRMACYLSEIYNTIFHFQESSEVCTWKFSFSAKNQFCMRRMFLMVKGPPRMTFKTIDIESEAAKSLKQE